MLNFVWSKEGYDRMGLGIPSGIETIDRELIPPPEKGQRIIVRNLIFTSDSLAGNTQFSLLSGGVRIAGPFFWRGPFVFSFPGNKTFYCGVGENLAITSSISDVRGTLNIEMNYEIRG